MARQPAMVVIVAERWGESIGGREQYAADLLRYLTETGRAVRAATPEDPLPPDARVLALTPDTRATHYQLHGGLIADAFDAERASYESELRRALFKPALAFNRRRQRLLDREATLLERGVRLMTFCERDAALLRERGVPASRIVVSRPGVDLSQFTPPETANDEDGGPLRLVFAAHNFVLKGLSSAIRAVATARRHGADCALTVIGRGHAARFRRLAAQERIADQRPLCRAADAARDRGGLSQITRAAPPDLSRSVSPGRHRGDGERLRRDHDDPLRRLRSDR